MFDGAYAVLIIVFIFLFGGLFVFIISWGNKRKEVFERIEAKWKNFVKGETEICIDEFNEIRQLTLKAYTGQNASNYERKGAFIIINKTNNKFYINESDKIFNSINLQIKGRGNKELSEGVESGDLVSIKAFAYRFLSEEKQQNLLEDLKREYIKNNRRSQF